MSVEEGFLATIAAEPDDDTHRLVYADWLEEHDQLARAEWIRVQCELEPIRENHDSEWGDVLRAREIELLKHFHEGWWKERQDRFGERGRDIGMICRRGLPWSVQIPVQWYLDHGEELRAIYPTAQRLELFRVNGWGERLGQCPHLTGIRDLELACWTESDDVRDLLRSPYLARLRLLRLWANPLADYEAHYQALEACRELPSLQRVEILWGEPERFAGQPLFHAFDPFTYKFTMAPGGGGYFDEFFPGKLPDGTQVFGMMPQPQRPEMPLLLFDRDGNQLEERILPLPEHLVPTHGTYGGGEGGLERWWAWGKAIAAHLRETLGHRPCLIQVRDLRFSSDYGPYLEYLPNHIQDEIGLTDDPDLAPEDDREQGAEGYGGSLLDWIRDRKFVFWNGNDWWVNGITGDVEST